ncbi:unnamed protein product [marine sediment metagenome]|uniref:Response regulatory domain-containing protein n=1 Tax=marine sediment metagenome TaxID=412755 RepID=X1G743_9ZZZZ
MKNSSAGAKRILVVEDEPAICELCRRVLTGEGFEVDIAVNGKVAQDMIEDKKYDLFLIDIRLPEMDGKELYKWIHDVHLELINRVIFTTGSVIGGDTQTFLEQTAKPCLDKPFTPDELQTIVTETLRQLGK